MQSTTKKPLTRDLVATARETLEAIPPAPEEMLEVSVTEAIQLLMPTIQRLFKKGYKRPKVVEFLREQGIECSEATLKTLYRAPKSRKDKAGKGTDRATPNGTTDAGDGGGTAVGATVTPPSQPGAGSLAAARKPPPAPSAGNGAAGVPKAP